MSYPIWFYLLNARARSLFASHPVELSPLQRSIVERLRADGIAVTSLEELAPGKLAELQAYAATLSPIEKGGKKDFILEYWDAEPTLSLRNPFVEFSLSSTVLDTVNAYMGMWSKFYYFMLGKTLPMGAAEARASQRWHRDYEEIQMCKMFIYLNDVTEASGPFIYIKGSQRGGKWRRVFPPHPGIGTYPPDGALEKIIPESEWTTYTGKAGTVVFADTTGLHRGGYGEQGGRHMFTAGFNSPAAIGRKRYRLPKDANELASLTEGARFALRGITF